jgi:lipopolysaccharide transport system permease protein
MANQLPRQAEAPLVRIEACRGWFDFQLGELWSRRELLYFLTWRDLKVRYKQTVLGALWAVLQPFVMMVVFTVVLGKLAKVPSDGIPYPIFAFTALVPWTFFSKALSRCIPSLVANASIVSKVYFPRAIVVLSAALSGILDFVVSFFILLGMMVWFGFVPNWGILVLPLYILFALLTALAVSLWLAALNVKIRDVSHGAQFLTQVWMYASPVVYPVSLVPEKWRLLYSLNPMVGVLEGFRWALLGSESPDLGVLAVSAAGVFLLLLGGMVYFRRVERTMVDVI